MASTVLTFGGLPGFLDAAMQTPPFNGKSNCVMRKTDLRLNEEQRGRSFPPHRSKLPMIGKSRRFYRMLRPFDRRPPIPQTAWVVLSCEAAGSI